MTKPYAYVGKMRYPLHVEDIGKNMRINWAARGPAWSYIKDEIKGCEGSRFHPDSKTWTVTHPRYSFRNRVALGLLSRNSIPHTDDSIIREYKSPIESFDLPDIEYRDYQRDDINHILTRHRIQLEAEMGLGKTLIAKTVAHKALNSLTFTSDTTFSQDSRDLFWVIGSRGALNAWRSENIKWRDTLPEEPLLLMNSVQSIEKAMQNAPHPPLVLIIDESANFKNAQAKRTQVVIELSRLMHDCWEGAEFIVTMTGTPVPKEPSDLHAQIEIVCPGFIREKNRAQLNKRIAHVETQQGPHGQFSKVVGWNTKEVSKFYERLKPIRIIRHKKDVESQLPDKIYIRRELKPTADMLSAAKLAVKSLPAVEALGAVRQLSDGFRYQKDEAGTRTGVTKLYTPKDDQLLDELTDIAEAGGTRAIVWAAFQGSIDKLKLQIIEFGWNVVKVDGRGTEFLSTDSDTAITDFDTRLLQDEFQLRNLDKPLVFLGNPDAASEGLTLTRASTMIFYSNSFKGDKRRQAEDRFHRIGMDENVCPRVIDLIHLPTDQLVVDNLKAKKDLEALTQGEILSSLERAALEGIV